MQTIETTGIFIGRQTVLEFRVASAPLILAPAECYWDPSNVVHEMLESFMGTGIFDEEMEQRSNNSSSSSSSSISSSSSSSKTAAAAAAAVAAVAAVAVVATSVSVVAAAAVAAAAAAQTAVNPKFQTLHIQSRSDPAAST